MTLRNMDHIDILRAAKRDALNHARVWMDIVQYLEKQIAQEYSIEVDVTLSEPYVDADGIQWSYTSEGSQGNDLPRDGERDEPVRYHRGSKASDEGPLRQ